jgi:hypothetical protein
MRPSSVPPEMIDEYLRQGGTVTYFKPGTPKDLKRMRRSGWLFGGKRTYVATMHARQDRAGGTMFDVAFAKPTSKNRKLSYDF